MKFIRMKVYPVKLYPDEILSDFIRIYPDEIYPDEVLSGWTLTSEFIRMKFYPVENGFSVYPDEILSGRRFIRMNVYPLRTYPGEGLSTKSLPFQFHPVILFIITCSRRGQRLSVQTVVSS